MPLDAESKRLILQRQHAAGWDAPAQHRPRQLAHRRRHHRQLGAPTQQVDLLANMRTDAQARGVLGIVAKRLHDGYQAAETFPFSASHNFPGGADAKGAAIDLLNQANTYAQKIYATIPDDTAPVAPPMRKTVTIAVKNALKAVKLVSNAANNLNQSLLQDLVDYLAGEAKKATGLGIPKPVIYGALALGGVIALFLVAKIVHTAVLGDAALQEAEETAMKLADASQRKKAARSVATIT